MIEDIYPLSPMQQGMLFHSVYATGSSIYFEQMSCALLGELDVRALKQAWQEVVDRYAVLRSSFAWEELDEPVQVVERQATMPFTVLDWRALSPEEQSIRLNEFLVADRAAGFNLLEAPLMRVTVMQMGAERYHLVWSHHHLLLDGWSVLLLLRDVFTLYEAHAKGEPLHLPPVRPFRDYIAWLQRQDMTQAEIFWREYLRGFTAATPLPLARASSQTSAISSREGHSEKRAELSHEIAEKLVRLARSYQLTLNTVVQGAYAVLLSRYSGERDVVFGATVFGRPPDLEGVENMLGLFINTLPVRVEVDGERLVDDWLRELQARNAEARQFEYAPLTAVQQWSSIGSGKPLFDSLFVFENYPVDSDLNSVINKRGGSLELDEVINFELTNYPLVLLVAVDEEIRLLMSWDQSRFDEESIEQLLRHLVVLLEAIAENPKQRLKELSLVTTSEREELIVGCNETRREYLEGVCVHELFEQQVCRTPDAVALTFNDQELTYVELNARANRLAHYLRGRGVDRESRVGILLERSVELVVSLLAVLRAGGAYVPLDPDYPEERLRFMLADSECQLVLTNSSLTVGLHIEDTTRVINLDTEGEAIAAESAESLGVTCDESNLAYVIYTSGSTGTPKGAMNEHRGVVNRLLWMQEEYGLGQRDAVLQKTPLSFDVSVWEFFWPLLTGARLVLAEPGGQRDAAYLARLIQREGVTTLHFVPSMLGAFLEEAEAVKCAQVLRRVICSGEALGWSLRERFFERLEGVALHNLYGPTEAAIDVTAWHCQPDDTSGVVPIGRPVANTQIHVVDERLEVVPRGVAGELCIGGVQVGRGYLQRPRLTAERFVPDPFSGEKGARLYRTGDVVRRLREGELEYLGRGDQQVKLRGFRIELGEIEAALSRHEQVRESVVMAREAGLGEKRLVAYLVADPAPAPTELQQFLQQSLPEYMVPSAFVCLPQLPLTPNGKLDRNALPPPDWSSAKLDGRYAPPTNQLEEDLAKMWGELLGVERIGINDNFFELGGHSLMAMQLVSRVRAEFGLEIPLPEFFRTPTIKRLAEMIEEVFLASSDGDEVNKMLTQLEAITDNEAHVALKEMQR